ncbi:NAD-dependent epimerase/dehydratase [Capsaspora owczarzaki ATCC 30864]|uniref:NAD-dependent epimerase/dehydratase n=1 Tax=Capsaspora owczarzaki (strain ATCC 30864) TaxID=595528 RepID=UPI0001FE3AE6|nr:NAD-dependent epimerase/dehydratase [Capsaspora owczarzaki ATCC 30864]|eukprot:XP_004364956.1 NAD-dependent epimerase/dehydratase [Capsaspora owczarzaki ATCC 30864]
MPPRGSSCVRSRRICMLTAATAILLLIVVGYSLISESELSATGQTPRQRLQLLFRQQRLDAAAAAAADGDQAEAMEEAELLPPVQAQPVHLLSDHIPARIPPNDRAILVTGGAGFVGMNVVAQLARDKHAHTIVAIDNFAHPAVSDKWNARTLMQDRAFNISRMHGVVVVDGDICNRPFLARLFDRYRFTDVLHLADARAGRHSSNHTDVTVRANIDCFVSLLETMKMFLHPKESLSSSPDSGSNVHRLPRLIFASSADVYGLNDASSGPSASWARVDRPHSMYSATSKGAEVLAWSYHATTGIPMIGLRLFSVFGAWADASSALSAFARGFLSSSSKVTLHSLRAKAGASTTEFPERDFIHISDVSNAVVLAMNADYIDFAVINLGFGQPRSVRDVAALLAQELVDQLGGKSLNDEITIGPLPRGELARTCADTQDLIMTLEYLPAVSFRAGLQDFVRWFLWYHHVSADRRTLSTEWVTPSPAVGEFIAKLESARAKQQEKSEKMMAATIADAKRARIESDRAHLVALDQARGVSLPLLDGLSTKSFVLVEKLFPQSADMVLLDFAVDRPDELIKACNRYDECLAFTPHDGYLKHQLGDIAAAQPVDPVRDTSTGTYVAGKSTFIWIGFLGMFCSLG